ncbi:hypothetical protein E4T56_gene8940, partial [Termitomyces sp. T112]
MSSRPRARSSSNILQPSRGKNRPWKVVVEQSRAPFLRGKMELRQAFALQREHVALRFSLPEDVLTFLPAHRLLQGSDAMTSMFHRSVLALAAMALLAGTSVSHAQDKSKPLKKYESGTKEFWTHPPDDWFLGDETEAQKGLAPPS